jgi:formylglycine-generating enzyme required for sulfatase activity
VLADYFRIVTFNSKEEEFIMMKKMLLLVIVTIALTGVCQGQGMLKIVTDPGDAKIYINGKCKGSSPSEVGQTFAIKLSEGEYEIEAIITSGGPKEQYAVKPDVYVADDTMQTITLNLKERISPDFLDKMKAKYGNGIPEPTMVAILGGSFQMGCVSGNDCSSDEKPVHQVTLSAFEMSQTEVTFAQYDACVVGGGCDSYPDDQGWGRDDRPVIYVSWNDAQQYISWLNQQTGKQYRLPTEAEWEYAARAGSTTKYSWGNAIGNNKANCDGCGSQWDGEQTAPVASLAANAFGLYDMHGNVWEWCSDWYGKNYYSSSSASDPQGPSSGSSRVKRGGSWLGGPAGVRSVYRYYGSPGYGDCNQGFRLAL